MKSIKVKCWIEEEGEKFYGPGPHELVKRIQTERSLSKAAEKMHLSYRKAWKMVKRLNQNSAEPLVILKKGGQHGGGAEVTPHALKIMEKYENLQNKIYELIDKENEWIKF